jgi:serine/threonine-protein kinase
VLGPGHTIADRYVLWDVIAEGSMGTVWLAQHLTLERPFAVKFLKTPTVSTFRLRERFIREARLTAAVRSPHVVDVVDYGVLEDGTPFMVMELLDGEPLARRLRREPPLGVRELLRLTTCVLDGLEAVHQAGVVHRDVKPENVVLVHRGTDMVPKLVDFGVCCMTMRELDGERSERLTAPGTTFGTPWYMSPEHAMGLDVDGRTDLYGVGVMLYEALSGRLPFDAPEGDVIALLRAVASGGVAPLAEQRSDLPPQLACAIDRALASNPEARFATAADMAGALREAAVHVPRDLVCAIIGGAPRGDGTGTAPITPPKLAVAPARPPARWPARAAVTVQIAVLGLALVGAAAQLGAGRRGNSDALAARPAASATGPRPASVAAAPTRAEPAEAPAAARSPSEDGEARTVATTQRRWQRRADRRPPGPPALFRHPGF